MLGIVLVIWKRVEFSDLTIVFCKGFGEAIAKIFCSMGKGLVVFFFKATLDCHGFLDPHIHDNIY